MAKSFRRRDIAIGLVQLAIGTCGLVYLAPKLHDWLVEPPFPRYSAHASATDDRLSFRLCRGEHPLERYVPFDATLDRLFGSQAGSCFLGNGELERMTIACPGAREVLGRMRERYGSIAYPVERYDRMAIGALVECERR